MEESGLSVVEGAVVVESAAGCAESDVAAGSDEGEGAMTVVADEPVEEVLALVAFAVEETEIREFESVCKLDEKKAEEVITVADMKEFEGRKAVDELIFGDEVAINGVVTSEALVVIDGDIAATPEEEVLSALLPDTALSIDDAADVGDTIAVCVDKLLFGRLPGLVASEVAIAPRVLPRVVRAEDGQPRLVDSACPEDGNKVPTLVAVVEV